MKKTAVFVIATAAISGCASVNVPVATSGYYEWCMEGGRSHEQCQEFANNNVSNDIKEINNSPLNTLSREGARIAIDEIKEKAERKIRKQERERVQQQQQQVYIYEAPKEERQCFHSGWIEGQQNWQCY